MYMFSTNLYAGLYNGHSAVLEKGVGLQEVKRERNTTRRTGSKRKNTIRFDNNPCPKNDRETFILGTK